MPTAAQPRDPRALTAIVADLDRRHRAKRRRYLPVLALAVVALTGTLAVFGTRPDLLDQPASSLVLLAALWILCLVLFPAIGVGLLFVSRGSRLALAFVAVLGTVAAVTGWPLGPSPGLLHPHALAGGATMVNGCFGVAAGAGALVLGIGVLSGAFMQRRRFSSVYWIASGLALMSLNVATSHCPDTGLHHVLPNHVGAAAALMGLALVAGLLVRHRASR